MSVKVIELMCNNAILKYRKIVYIQDDMKFAINYFIFNALTF